MQLFHQRHKRSPLRFGASVLGRFAVGGAASNQADTDRVCVLPCGVRTDLLDGSALVDRAIAIDNEVIADATEATLTMPLVYLLHGKILALRRSRAMDNDFVNYPHGLWYYVIDWSYQEGVGRTDSDS